MILTNLKAFFTCLERVQELKCLPAEPPHRLPADRTRQAWPQHGDIAFDHVSLQYTTPGVKVLDDISVAIPAGCRVGVVGRTGAGKSSFMSLIFRLVDATEGRITIDGVDTRDVGLEMLRRKIAIIPQEPILMQGTVRYNLDPFNTQDEGVIRDVMRRVELDPVTLDVHVEASGHGLSEGQKQLICFARALLTGAPVILMDEPTANCDLETGARTWLR